MPRVTLYSTGRVATDNDPSGPLYSDKVVEKDRKIILSRGNNVIVECSAYFFMELLRLGSVVEIRLGTYK